MYPGYVPAGGMYPQGNNGGCKIEKHCTKHTSGWLIALTSLWVRRPAATSRPAGVSADGRFSVRFFFKVCERGRVLANSDEPVRLSAGPCTVSKSEHRQLIHRWTPT